MRRIGLLALFFLLSITLIGLVGEGSFQPDLTVSELRVLPPYPEPGDKALITFAVSNIGRGSVGQSFDVRLKLDGVTIFRQRLRRMRPGEVKEYQVQWEATAGRHQVLVEVDRPRSRVPESNERNNTASLAFEVRSKGVLYSFTDAVFTMIGTPLVRTGEMFKLDLSGDLFAALDAGVAQLTAAQEILTDYSLQLEYADYGLPAALANAVAFVQAKRIGEVFTAMAAAIGEAAAGLKGMNLNRAIGAIQRVESYLNTLAGLGFDGLNLTPLAQAATHVDKAVQIGLRLQASLFGSGSGGGTEGEGEQQMEKLIQDFQKELAKAGDLIKGVGAQALGLPGKQGVKLLSAGSENPTNYRIGEPLTVQALGTGVTELEFTVYDANGAVVFTTTTSGSQLTWNGRDKSGRPLPSGRYFYRALVHRGGVIEEEIGRIIAS